MDRKMAGGYLKGLSKYLDVEKCGQCECLQGSLLQLKLDFPDFKDELTPMLSKKFHCCLGCNPCDPAKIWERYLKEKGGDDD